MPVIRYRTAADMPSAMIGDDVMTPAEGLRLACELSETALRLAGARGTPRGVRRRGALISTDVDPAVEVPNTNR